MINYRIQNRFIISLSFMIAIILQIIPLPIRTCIFYPSWVLLTFIYWTSVFPYLFNLRIIFILGIFIDLIIGTTLGVHALAFIVISYFLIVLKLHLFLKLAIWYQILIIMLLSLFVKIIIFLLNFLVIHISFQSEIFWNAIVDGIIWPVISFLIKKNC
ncbi:rod shape-determining protein MreD [Pantoea sp. Aalb]|uniref:rod shape-determining protein MreD n=1 Tax=Pantoea sp. Aalb TaxID=2576762 RepID=UPI00132C0FF9|nr:rod shape-determining protein MreD [Pantoea sp. Aalb]MXP67664.1 rod shape-determining protein MreD [Pantoea sp. Aalb]